MPKHISHEIIQNVHISIMDYLERTLKKVYIGMML